MVSVESAQVLDSTLSLPSLSDENQTVVWEAMKEQLTKRLDVDPKYVILVADAAVSRVRRLVPSDSLNLRIRITTANETTLSADLYAIAKDPSFWEVVNDQLAANGAALQLDPAEVVNGTHVSPQQLVGTVTIVGQV